jgi:hypothetical protein
VNHDCKRSGDPPFAATPWLGIFGAILMGAGSGSEADVIPYMIAEYFGRKRFATLYGLVDRIRNRRCTWSHPHRPRL